MGVGGTRAGSRACACQARKLSMSVAERFTYVGARARGDRVPIRKKSERKGSANDYPLLSRLRYTRAVRVGIRFSVRIRGPPLSRPAPAQKPPACVLPACSRSKDPPPKNECRDSDGHGANLIGRVRGENLIGRETDHPMGGSGCRTRAWGERLII